MTHILKNTQHRHDMAVKMLKSIVLTCTTNAYIHIGRHLVAIRRSLLRQALEIYSQPIMPVAAADDDDRAQQLPGMEPKVIAISNFIQELVIIVELIMIQN